MKEGGRRPSETGPKKWPWSSKGARFPNRSAEKALATRAGDTASTIVFFSTIFTLFSAPLQP